MVDNKMPNFTWRLSAGIQLRLRVTDSCYHLLVVCNPVRNNGVLTLFPHPIAGEKASCLVGKVTKNFLILTPGKRVVLSFEWVFGSYFMYFSPAIQHNAACLL